jgi:tripartite-type tricarboxylate transporter receptor subunit TctC
MKTTKRFILATAIILLALACIGAEGQKETSMDAYPEREIEAVITWGAGGLTDNIARNFLPLMEEELGGASIVPQNKTGASGAIGSQYVMSQDADGYTMLVTTTESCGVWNVMGTSDMDVSDFKPVMILTSLNPTCYVRSDAPWDTVQELVEDAKSRPGKIISGFAAPGSLGHVSGLLFSEYSGSEFNMVPFGGGGKVMAALLGGHVQVAFNPLVSIMENYKAEKIKLLATFTDEEIVEGVPALSAEMPAFDEVLPYGIYVMIMVHKDTPDEIVAKLTGAALKASENQKWQEFADKYYLQIVGATGADFTEKVEAWKPVTTWLLYDAGVATKSPEEFGIPRK